MQNPITFVPFLCFCSDLLVNTRYIVVDFLYYLRRGFYEVTYYYEYSDIEMCHNSQRVATFIVTLKQTPFTVSRFV